MINLQIEFKSNTEARFIDCHTGDMVTLLTGERLAPASRSFLVHANNVRIVPFGKTPAKPQSRQTLNINLDHQNKILCMGWGS